MAGLRGRSRLAVAGVMARPRVLSRGRRGGSGRRAGQHVQRYETECHDHERQAHENGPAHRAPRGAVPGRHPVACRARAHAGLAHHRRTGGGHPGPGRGQVRPVPLRAWGGQQLVQADRGHRPRRPVVGVVVLDQRLGVGADGLGDGADMTTGIEVAATLGEVVRLDLPDDRFPDQGSLADLGQGQACLVPRLRQGLTDGHATPPLVCRCTHRPRPRDARVVSYFLAPRSAGEPARPKLISMAGRGREAGGRQP